MQDCADPCEGEKMGGRRSRAIVCDDDPIMRNLIRARLRTLVDEVVEAPDGLTAWRLLSTETFHIALIDLNMPGIDGFDLIQCLRGHPRTRHLPIMVLTSSGESASLTRALEVGASAYMTKPLAWSVFGAQVAHTVRLSVAAIAAERDLARFQALNAANSKFAAALGVIATDGIERIDDVASKISAAQYMISAPAMLNDNAHNIGDLVRTACVQARPSMPSRDVRAQINTDANITCNRQAIVAALKAMISVVDMSAVHSIPLEVTAKMDGSNLTICLDAEQVEFEQVILSAELIVCDENTKRLTVACNVDLAIAMTLIEAHSGTLVSALNENGRRRLRLTLPGHRVGEPVRATQSTKAVA